MTQLQLFPPPAYADCVDAMRHALQLWLDWNADLPDGGRFIGASLPLQTEHDTYEIRIIRRDDDGNQRND